MSSRGSIVLLLLVGSTSAAEPPPRAERLTVRVLGLFAPEREKVLRTGLTRHPEVKVVELNCAEAELTVEFVRTKVFPGAKPEQLIERLNELVRAATDHTIGVAARTATPKERLTVIVIPVAGCHCAACNLAAAEAIDKMEGVDRVTCSFKDGKLTARIDPGKVQRAALEAALKQREVTVLGAAPRQ